MEDILTKVYDLATTYGLKIVGAIVILIVGRFVVGMITNMIRRMMERANVDVTLTKFVAALTKTALMVILFIVVLNQIGVQTTSFVALIGAVGLAGLARQLRVRRDDHPLPSVQGRRLRRGRRNNGQRLRGGNVQHHSPNTR